MRFGKDNKNNKRDSAAKRAAGAPIPPVSSNDFQSQLQSSPPHPASIHIEHDDQRIHVAHHVEHANHAAASEAEVAYEDESHLPDILKLANANKIRGGDDLRNINSYAYLRHVFLAAKPLIQDMPLSDQKYFGVLIQLNTFMGDGDYHEDISYGNYYTDFLLKFEDAIALLLRHIDEIKNDKKFQPMRDEPRDANGDNTYTRTLNDLEGLLPHYRAVFNAIYENDNQSLRRTAAMFPKDFKEAPHAAPSMQGSVSKFFKPGPHKRGAPTHRTSARYEGSALGRLITFVKAKFGSFRPMAQTSIPSEITYDYMQASDTSARVGVRQLRMGTQAEMDKHKTRTNPLFRAWRLANPESKHLYINNLGWDRKSAEGKLEKQWTEALHAAGKELGNLYVITLPADMGLMSKNMLLPTEERVSYEAARERMFNIAVGKSNERIQDFYISKKVKELVYTKEFAPYYTKINEDGIIQELLQKSFEKMGFNEASVLTNAELQAVYFHFIKYELTNHIIEKLNPDTVNISCKDAIDRGGVASAYYNLMKSIEQGNPLSHAEFLQAIHAAPAMVKGRGINHHGRLLFNAVQRYVAADKLERANNPLSNRPPLPTWLEKWVDDNANLKPYYEARLEAYIKLRGSQRPHIFSLGIPGPVKIAAAEKLLNILKNNTGGIGAFSSGEWDALYQGRLGKIFSDMQKDHVDVNIRPYQPREELRSSKP